MARFGKERCSSPLLLAAGAPAATVDETVYIAPALRCAQSHTPANLETVLMAQCSWYGWLLRARLCLAMSEVCNQLRQYH